jgi:hypothetical protein
MLDDARSLGASTFNPLVAGSTPARPTNSNTAVSRSRLYRENTLSYQGWSFCGLGTAEDLYGRTARRIQITAHAAGGQGRIGCAKVVEFEKFDAVCWRESRELAPTYQRPAGPCCGNLATIIALQACTTLPRLAAVPPTQTARAIIPGFPNNRYWLDEDLQALLQEVIRDDKRERETLARLGMKAS